LSLIGSAFVDDRFAVLPICIAGSLKDSIPEDFQRVVAEDFSGMQVMTWNRTGKASPTHNYRSRYSRFIQAAVNSATVVAQLRARDADRGRREGAERIFEAIFRNLKHDSHQLERKTVRQLFVKTLEFKRVIAQASYILVGRKGSGKSTLADFLTFGVSNGWKPPHLFNVDELNLEFLHTITASAPHQSDQRHVIPQATLMAFAWQATFHFLCYESLKLEHESGVLSEAQRALFSPIASTFISADIQGVLDDDGERDLSPEEMSVRRHAFFGIALGRSLQFVAEVIAGAPTNPDVFNGYILKRLTPEQFLIDLFGKRPLKTFYLVVGNCQKNFLITLDGFDSNFQRFRQETLRSYKADDPAFEQRNRFEQDWLSGLIAAVRYAKRGSKRGLIGKVDFCITIPKDRFLEFLDYDRDAFEWESKQIDISWTGVELALLLRKRLEVLRGTTSQKMLAFVRLRHVLEKHFPDLPKSIPIQLDRRLVEVPILQYVLRHTFWRPRDILFIWGRIVAAAEHYREKGLNFSADEVKLIVSRSLEPIIEFEFIGEFKGYVGNIPAIISCFRGAPQVMRLDMFYSKLSGMKLATPTLHSSSARTEDDRPDPEKILAFLFGVGFVGFYTPEKTTAPIQLHSAWAFQFNEGNGIIRSIAKVRPERLNVVIHPAFIEYLSLTPYRENLTCDWPDDYLLQQEANQAARST
jgi:hypothetical protein